MPNSMSIHTRQYDTYYLGAVMIKAAINLLDGEIFDWAAYIGPVDWGDERILAHGTKLLPEQAVTFFTQLPIENYRR